jgi:hypothetical protein
MQRMNQWQRFGSGRSPANIFWQDLPGFGLMVDVSGGSVVVVVGWDVVVGWVVVNGGFV